MTLGSVPLTQPSPKKRKEKKQNTQMLSITKVAKILYMDFQRGGKSHCLGVYDMQCSLKNGGFPGGPLVKNSPMSARERNLQDIHLAWI